MNQINLKGQKIPEKKQMEFELKEAEEIANDIVKRIGKYAIKIEIVGSIRRKKQKVHDIDIVIIPKPHFSNWISTLPNIVLKRKGEKIIEFDYRGMQIDINLANSDTYETLKLIKTGSAEHNIKLCLIAKEKGMHLFADGQGLWKEGIFEKIADTEEGILINLLGKNIPPEERD